MSGADLIYLRVLREQGQNSTAGVIVKFTMRRV